MRDRLRTVTGIVRGAVQDAVRGVRMAGRASEAIFRKLAPTSVQQIRGRDDSADIPPNAKAAHGRTVPSSAAQATGAGVPRAAEAHNSTVIAADQETPQVLSPTAPMTEPGTNKVDAAKKAAPAKMKKTKATDQKAATGSKGAGKKAAPVKQEPAKKTASAKKVPPQKTAPAKKVAARKAAAPKISPAETAAPTTVPQPPAEVDGDADTGASGVSATRAEDLAP